MSPSCRKRVLVAYGTRPEAIKLAPLIVQLKKQEGLEVIVVCTGQHNELLKGILEIWNLSNDKMLNTTSEGTSISNLPHMMLAVSEVLREFEPDIVLVQGDTATAFATTTQSYLMKIPVAHVEAGLRSHDIWNPWPEEGYRKAIDAMSSYHFAPTKIALDNLVQEGLSTSTVNVGNTVVDALKFVLDVLDFNPQIGKSVQEQLKFDMSSPYVVFTQHRREGFGRGQDLVFDAIKVISETHMRVVFPVHLNPRVKSKASEFFSGCENVQLIEPLEYLQFVELLRNCSYVISDSGGLQEEVPTLKKKIFITRLTTERPEVVESGYGFLTGYETNSILEAFDRECRTDGLGVEQDNPFGDGRSSERISEYLKKVLSLG